MNNSLYLGLFMLAVTVMNGVINRKEMRGRKVIHPFYIALTRLNVYAGLVGAYIIHDPKEKRLKLPSDEYDVPLLITDRTINEDG